MVGYPNGLWDKSHDPADLLVRGITASHPEIDFCGKPELLVDIACFPGSSGSPVFVLNANGRCDERGNTRCDQPQNLLLGVVPRGGDDQLRRASRGAPRIDGGPASPVEFATHLTYVIKSRELLRFADVMPRRRPGHIEVTPRVTGRYARRR